MKTWNPRSMTDSHILNAMKWVERKIGSTIRIGGGSDPHDFWLDDIPYVVPKEYFELCDEARKRRLISGTSRIEARAYVDYSEHYQMCLQDEMDIESRLDGDC